MFYYDLDKILIGIDIGVEHPWKNVYKRKITKTIYETCSCLISKEWLYILLEFYNVYSMIFLRVCLIIFSILYMQ